MTVYGLFHGGYSYSPPDLYDDLETFPSINAAKEALDERYHSDMRIHCTHHYADGHAKRVLHLCDESAELQLFLTDPRIGDFYPDQRLFIGPRGGIRCENR